VWLHLIFAALPRESMTQAELQGRAASWNPASSEEEPATIFCQTIRNCGFCCGENDYLNAGHLVLLVLLFLLVIFTILTLLTNLLVWYADV
jgi:hypothetical protein